MATYIPGVKSYLPNFEPFTPDYKFLSNVLDVQTNRYNTNYKAVNDLYSKVVYGDLSRGDTQEMRAQYAENLGPKLQQISGMDLAMAQNTEAAKSIFKPFFEDDLIVRDLVFTKQYKNEMSLAESLQNSPDKAQREMYWSTGVEKMRYEMEDFVNASEQEAMTIRAPKYTPDADLYETAVEFLKKSGISDVKTEVSKDGNWMITRTNGDLITNEALQATQRALKDDPRVVNAFHADAFVKSRRFAQQGMEAGQFKTVKEGQSAWATEQIDRMEILMDSKIKTKQQQLKLQKDIVVSWQNYENEFGILEDTKEAKEKREQESKETALEMSIEDYKNSLMDNKGVNTQGATAPGQIQESPNLQALMNRAYGLLMNYSMEKDLQAAAVSYSNIGKKVELDENQFALNKQKHQYNVALENRRASNNRSLAKYKDNLERAQIQDQNRMVEMMNKMQVLQGETGTTSAKVNKKGELDKNTDVIAEQDQNMLKLKNKLNQDMTSTSLRIFEAINGNQGTINLGPKYGNVNGSSADIKKYLQQNPAKAEEFFNDVNKLMTGGNPEIGSLNGGKAPSWVAKNTQNGNFKQMSKAMFQLNSERALLEGIDLERGRVSYENFQKAVKLGLVDEDKMKDWTNYEKQGVSIFDIGPDGKKVLLTEDEFKQKVRDAGSLLDTDGDDINEVGFGNQVAEFLISKLDPRTWEFGGGFGGFGGSNDAPVSDQKGKFMEAYKRRIKSEYNENVEENAQDIYDAQKQMLNSTLNATWRNNASLKNEEGEVINTTDIFQLFDVKQAYRGTPTASMTVGDFQSNPTYSVIADPMNPTEDAMDMLGDLMRQKRQGTLNTFINGDMVSAGKASGGFMNPYNSNVDLANWTQDPLTEKLFDAWVNDISRLQQKGATKSDYPTAKIRYQPHITGDSEDLSSDGNSFGQYEITFDSDWISKQVGKNKLLGKDATVEKYQTISMVFPKKTDQNPKRFGETNESYVGSTIAISPDHQFTYNVPRGGQLSVTQNSDGQYVAQVQNVQWDPNKNENVMVSSGLDPVVIGGSADRRRIDMDVMNLIEAMHNQSGSNFTSEMSVKKTNIK